MKGSDGRSALDTLHARSKGEYWSLPNITEKEEVLCLQLFVKACLDREQAFGLTSEALEFRAACTNELDDLAGRSAEAATRTDDGTDDEIFFDASQTAP